MTRYELDARIDLIVGKVTTTRYVAKRKRTPLPKTK